MKNQTQHGTNGVSGVFALIVGGLITLILMLLTYFNIFHLDAEVVFAPFIVITLLTYGDKLLIYLLLNPINFVSKLINKTRDSSI